MINQDSFNKVIRIGRSPENDCCLLKEDDKQLVSRQHSVIYINGKDVSIEDLNSANGTYVNGFRIEKKVLHPKDTVRIANKYALNMKNIFGCIPGFNTDECDDYSLEFETLRNVWDRYETQKAKIIKKSQNKQQWGKTCLVSIPILGFIVIARIFKWNEWYFPFYIGLNTLLTSVAFFLIRDKKKSEQLKKLEIDFRKIYRCPRCGYQLRENWDLHHDQHNCPSCKAIWMKPVEPEF
ncbi:MAG: FHA domain-containing protein [Prevotellaceae bacterium]|jgi:DNA-directed RNA polymerase subunit RPC12/RpoP|nr:FHA domain-containing protein [Prevotellaceae bacterium]